MGRVCSSNSGWPDNYRLALNEGSSQMSQLLHTLPSSPVDTSCQLGELGSVGISSKPPAGVSRDDEQLDILTKDKFIELCSDVVL